MCKPTKKSLSSFIYRYIYISIDKYRYIVIYLHIYNFANKYLFVKLVKRDYQVISYNFKKKGL